MSRVIYRRIINNWTVKRIFQISVLLGLLEHMYEVVVCAATGRDVLRLGCSGTGYWEFLLGISQ